jgi:hypothetical protein
VLAAEAGDNADGCAGSLERRQVRPHDAAGADAAGAFVNKKSRVKMSEQRLATGGPRLLLLPPAEAHQTCASAQRVSWAPRTN